MTTRSEAHRSWCATHLLALCTALLSGAIYAPLSHARNTLPSDHEPVSQIYQDCLSHAGDGEQTACVDKEFARQDARLNANYRALAASVDATARDHLRNEERQWMAGRDRDCGRAAGNKPNSCSLSRTRYRADVLGDRIGVVPATAAAIQGDWEYGTDCNGHHNVSLNVSSTGDPVQGRWSDGSDLHVYSGSFRGQLRDGRLYGRFCADDAMPGRPACPAFEERDNNYFVTQGTNLLWYLRVGGPTSDTYVKYVTLRRAGDPTAAAAVDCVNAD
jgi:uncharacterized protein YecT (DUF1311 family)